MSWRDTLFVWKGKATVDVDQKSFSWEGSWIGVDCALTKNLLLPSESSFEKSNMNFAVVGKIISDENDNKLELSTLKLQVTGGKGWLLDDMEYHQDDKHTVLFLHKKGFRTVNVGANGFNEYGSFISLGYCSELYSYEDIMDGKEFNLVLGRRYLSDSDPRSSWQVNVEVKRLLESADHLTNDNSASSDIKTTFHCADLDSEWPRRLGKQVKKRSQVSPDKHSSKKHKTDQ